MTSEPLPGTPNPGFEALCDAMSLRDFAHLCERAQREGDTETLAAIDARHRARGYGGAVVDEAGVMASCQPKAPAEGPRVRCSCTSEMLASQFEEHATLYARAAGSLSAWTLHGTLLVDRGLPSGTPPAIVAHLPSIEAPVSLELQGSAPEARAPERPAVIPSPDACEDAPVSPAIHTAHAHDSAELPLFARARVA